MAQLRLGVIVGLTEEPEKDLARVKELGLPTCQVSCWNSALLTPELARRLKDASLDTGVEITAIWAGWPGPAIWDFYGGPITLGLVPVAYRAMRVEALKKASDFAREVGVQDVITHAGFIPENPNDPAYPELIVALRHIAMYCKRNGQYFSFETGQETPTTLLRAITDVGTGNLGVNLDPGNLIMYGKANPVDALDVIGKYVRGVHAKDGEYPTTGQKLGHEKPLGQGRVNFPAFVAKLKDCSYTGALTIEREISGEQQVADIKLAMDLLRPLL